jgi:hypothetical protein
MCHVSGTTLVPNTYNLADELTNSVSTVGSSAPLTRTYRYDGNGNHYRTTDLTSLHRGPCERKFSMWPA